MYVHLIAGSVVESTDVSSSRLSRVVVVPPLSEYIRFYLLPRSIENGLHDYEVVFKAQ